MTELFLVTDLNDNFIGLFANEDDIEKIREVWEINITKIKF